MDTFSYSSAPVRKVKTIQFGILDPDFVVSVAIQLIIKLKISNTHSYCCLSLFSGSN